MYATGMSQYTGKPCARCSRKKGPKQKDLKYCATCQRAVKKERAKAQHEKHVQKTYDLSPGEYDALYEYQGGKCALCPNARGISKRLAVDHDHKLEEFMRGSIRGLLCTFCNHELLGRLGDDPRTYEAIAEYLRNPPAQRMFKENETK